MYPVSAVRNTNCMPQIPADWYLSGGAPTPVAVYEPLGEINLAASYTNKVNPGTSDAIPGIAPTLDANGWAFDGTQWLDTGIVPTANTVVICRFSNASGGGSRAVFGIGVSASNQRFYIRVRESLDRRYAWGTSNLLISNGILTSGVVGLAGANAYLNGIADGAVSATWTATTLSIAIGASKNATGVDTYYIGSIQAIAIWSTLTNYAVWVPAVMAAVNDL